jgi:peptidyl-prolyl cis-trans isomerase D
MFNWKCSKTEGLAGQKAKDIPTISVLLATLFAMVFFGVCDPSQQGATGPRGAAAKVDGSEVTYNQFARAYRQELERGKQQFGADFDPAMFKVARNTIDKLVDQEIMFKTAQLNGIDVSQDEVVAYLAKAPVFKDEKGQFKEENFKSWLKMQGYNEATALKDFRRDLAVQKLNQLMVASSFIPKAAARFDYQIKETKLNVEFVKFSPSTSPVEVTPEEVAAFAGAEANKSKLEAYYAQNTGEYNRPEEVKARHILIQYSGARNALGEAAKRSKDAAKKLASEALEKAKQGQDFAALAKSMTDEPAGKTSGGDLGFFTKDKMVKEFSDAAFALTAGSLSEIVESPFGFHIIKVEAKKPAESKTLEMVKNDIAKVLVTKEKAPALLKTKADDAFKAIKESGKLPAGLSFEETGEFSATDSSVPKIGAESILKDSLLGLKNVGDLIVSPILVQDSWYIARLKSRKTPDAAAQDPKQIETLATSQAANQGYGFYASYEKQVRKEFELRNAIKKNEDFLAIDNPKNNGG